MKGILFVNRFYKTPALALTYQKLTLAFEKRGVALKTVSVINGEPDTDFVLFWDKDVILAKRLEQQGIKVFNSAGSIEICDDKANTWLALADSGIRLPKTIVAPFTFPNIGYDDLSFLDGIAYELKYPLVVKAAKGSLGEQVWKVTNIAEFREIVKKNQSQRLVFQEFIGKGGRDVRIYAVGDKVAASVMRTAPEGEFRSNVTVGGRTEAFAPPEEFAEIAVESARICGASFAGVDILFDKDGTPVFCEINTNAQFNGIFDATGINIADYIAEEILSLL